MSTEQPSPAWTNHALLVAWGLYAQQSGLVSGIEGVPLHQKRRTHRPQTKVLEFLVAILAGLPHLQDISRSAHPLDQDEAVATAWGQPAWADYSGVSRTLQALRPAEAEAIVAVLNQLSQPIVDREVVLALRQNGYVLYDGDLTARPVANNSHTYPGAAFGHMGDGISLGYQAAMVSMYSPTYHRLWLSIKPHPGNTIACSQLMAMVRATEATTGIRPRRRLALLQGRLQQAEAQLEATRASLKVKERRLSQTEARLQAVDRERQQRQAHLEALVAEYSRLGRPERPHSRLAKARGRLAVYERRRQRRQQEVTVAQQRLEKQQRLFEQRQAMVAELQLHYQELVADNQHNPTPIKAIFRLDSGFGTPENVAWLIEMGYDVYTKPYGNSVTPTLRAQLQVQTAWERVGANAEMTAWAQLALSQHRYPLDAALVRYYQGDRVQHSACLHYGDDPVTQDLPAWFATYNGRQTIEAAIKEGKNVFQMHHLKVRSQPALFLQEHFATFAANFVRWAAHWLAESPTQPAPASSPLTLSQRNVKQQVQVMAHTSAWVFWQRNGCLLRFAEQSVYVGKSLQVGDWAFQPPLPIFKNDNFY